VTFSIVSAGKDKNDAWLANGGALRCIQSPLGEPGLMRPPASQGQCCKSRQAGL